METDNDFSTFVPTLDQKARETARHAHHRRRKRNRALMGLSLVGFSAVMITVFCLLTWGQYSDALLLMLRNAAIGFACGFAVFLQYFYISSDAYQPQIDTNTTLLVAILTALPYTLLGAISGLLASLPIGPGDGPRFALVIGMGVLGAVVGGILGWKSVGHLKN